MNPKIRLFRVALLGSLFCTFAFAANEKITLRPLDLPVVTKWVNPDYMPARYENSTVIVTMILDVTGQPRDIKIIEPRDPLLEKCLIPALAQCRFTPAQKAGVAVEAKVVLPVKIPLFDEDAGAPTQIGALEAVVPRAPQSAVPHDHDNHPAVFHVNAITLSGQKVLTDGATAAMVRDSLGSPEKISANVWAYANFSGMCEDADVHGCNTVLVAFKNDHVAAIALVNNRAKERMTEELNIFPNSLAERLQVMHEATAVAAK